MNKFKQGRWLLTWPPKYVPPRKPHRGCRHCQPNPCPRLVEQDPFERPRPRPIVFETIKCIKRLHPDEIKRFGYIFSEMLGLPKPPNIEINKETTGEKFVVKLVKCDRDNLRKLCREIAWIKESENVVVKDLSDLGLAPVIRIVNNMPSVIKQGVSKEEANDIIAKIEGAGGVAVMEPLEE